jgi:SpoVK/Ycf46/Vps4 family AAA+-type ATPase
LALIKCHVRGDDEHFQSVSLQVAADCARKGHHRVADQIKALVADARAKGSTRTRRQTAGGNHIRPEVAGLMMTSAPRFGLDRLVLDSKLSAKLRKPLREWADRAKLEAKGLSPRARFLLVGPSGTGKTMTAEAFAMEAGLPFHTVALHALITKFMGETGAKLRLIFDAIRASPGVYFFDEFDALAAARGSGDDVGEARRILNVLLLAIEGDIGTSMIFAATNHPELLDTAIFRRFDSRFTYRQPTDGMVRPVIEKSLPETFADSLRSVAWDEVAAAASGLSQAHMALAANDAARDAVLEYDGDVTTELLLQALAERADSTGPAVTAP